MQRTARWFGYAAALFLVAMMLITVTDVLLRSLFAIPIFGTFELIELCLVATIFLALPATFLREENVVVDLIDHLIPNSSNGIRWLRLLGLLLSLIFLAAMLWRMWQPALDTLEFGDQTLSLEIPKIVHWLPILFGVACTIVAVIAVLLRELFAKRSP
jgi:TRAP-type C4-dicarboxylate transport system permease small subunit